MITYCSNIYPGESFAETFFHLQNHLPLVKEVVSPGASFPIGLRLSNRAALEIDPETAWRFQAWCQEQNCYIPTLNGFSYGSFHSSPIKEKVYLPDWRYPERVSYTKKLAYLLDFWLPPNMTGSISTVPVGFKRHASEEDDPLIRQNLIDTLEYLDALRQKSGKEIILSFEPEPGCVLETTEEVIVFFDRMRFSRGLREIAGVCLDCCHQAVEFENPTENVRRLSEARIRIGKVQVSSTPRFEETDQEVLERFCEPRYLHQVVVRLPDGTLSRYDDLPEALKGHRRVSGEEWRIHFHIPIFMEEVESYGTTRFFIEEILPLLHRDILLEIETYTWDVLPREFRTETVTQSIIHEINWLRSQIDATNRCS